MNRKKFVGSFTAILILTLLCIAFVLLAKEMREQSIINKEEPEKQEIFSLTFDQRVAHMKKCFDAAEKITTLAWGESTGSITIQLYLDTIGDVSNIKKNRKRVAIHGFDPPLYYDPPIYADE